jgi:hypothetical protein
LIKEDTLLQNQDSKITFHTESRIQESASSKSTPTLLAVKNHQLGLLHRDQKKRGRCKAAAAALAS